MLELCDRFLQILNVDGSTGEKCKRARLILEVPDGHQYAYNIKLQFPISNNEAEYKHFLAGLHMARSLKLTPSL